MDNWLPPAIRDNKYFMYPVFRYWFKGKDISKIMNFKKDVFYMSKAEYTSLYENIETRAGDRPTDMNQASIEYIIEYADKTATTLLDVGAGRGYFLNVLSERTPFKLTGTDIYDSIPGLKADYVKGYIEELPFPDKSFDIVVCSHTVEHIIDLRDAINELKRVARKQLIIVTPCQRYNFYTLDLHVNFFPTKEMLNREIGMKDFECTNVQGDWVYLGKVS
ncbi:MAG: methyltransferase protein [Flavipsychrobacter sp.]|nr:methyltransferase protein [Flavipsychrobacter sp.]